MYEMAFRSDSFICSQQMDPKQLGRQVACGTTIRSEANEKLEVKAKADD